MVKIERSKMLSERKTVLKFSDLAVRTREERSWWRSKIVKKSTTLLKNVSGEIRSGDFVAVIGPSGAGKTTFLVKLAGKCTLPSEGSVFLDDLNVEEAARGVVEIVPQFEVFMETLTVLEHLTFMLEMKVKNSLSATKMTTLNFLLKELKLKAHAHTLIQGLSGGERRLLSLATSLISNPKVLICDEPTTGLDSYNASLVVGVLKTLASSGHVVVCSVHQPSSDIFKEFTSIILLSEGNIVFHGKQNLCKEVFESAELFCPTNYNAAEFYMRCISSSDNSNKILKVFSNLEENKDESEFVDPDVTYRDRVPFKISRRNWVMQVLLLVWRSSLTVRRNKMKHFIDMLTGVMISGIIVGFCYFGVSGRSQQGIQDIRGLLWLVTSEIAFGIGYTSLVAFEFDLTLFKRESGMYNIMYLKLLDCLLYTYKIPLYIEARGHEINLVAHYFDLAISPKIPKSVIWPIVYMIVPTIILDVPNKPLAATSMVLFLIGTGFAAASYGLCLGALFTSSHLTSEVMPCFDAVLVLTSGTFLRLSTLPIWIYSFKYLSHFYYGMDAISNIYWRQIEVIECTWNTTCISEGTIVLAEDGYSNHFVLQDSLGLMFVTLVWCVVGYFGLWREEKKGYAY